MDFAKKVSQVFFSKYTASFIDFFTSIIIVRNLGLYDYGRYNVIYLIPALIGSLGSFGLAPSFIYHLNCLNHL